MEFLWCFLADSCVDIFVISSLNSSSVNRALLLGPPPPRGWINVQSPAILSAYVVDLGENKHFERGMLNSLWQQARHIKPQLFHTCHIKQTFISCISFSRISWFEFKLIMQGEKEKEKKVFKKICTKVEFCREYEAWARTCRTRLG